MALVGGTLIGHFFHSNSLLIMQLLMTVIVIFLSFSTTSLSYYHWPSTLKPSQLTCVVRLPM